MEIKHKLFFDLFNRYGGMKDGELKLKRPSQLQEVLDIARKLIDECNQTDVEILATSMK